MTPGPKLENWNSLLSNLTEPESDQWKRMRLKLKRLAFDQNNQAEATSRLIAFMRDQNWLGP
jgi:hypothetical protein